MKLSASLSSATNPLCGLVHQRPNLLYTPRGFSAINTSEPSNLNAIALLESKIKSLHAALHDLQVEIEALSKVSDVSADAGTDFYEEVRRFEIYLIERALVQAKGIQKEAAKILKMRTSTLNQKIKLYNISSKYFAYQPSNNNGGDQEQKVMNVATLARSA